MKLPHHNWDEGREEWVDYPTEIFEPLAHFLLRTNHWKEDVELVEREVGKVKERMAAHRLLARIEMQNKEAQEKEMAIAREWGTLALRDTVEKWYEDVPDESK